MNDALDTILAHEDPVFRDAVKAVIGGDAAALEDLLDANPDLVRQRSSSPHHATLLHYVAANGVEDELQLTPPNAADIASQLLDAGAEVDGACDTYGGGALQTTLNLLVSSTHPADAGVMVAVVGVLCEAGARVDGVGDDGSPLATALGFGYPAAVDELLTRGARTDNLVFAAAAGKLDAVRDYFRDKGSIKPDVGRCVIDWFSMSTDPRVAAEQALVYAAMCGRGEVIEFLIDRGVDLDANPPGTNVTATALHTAAWQGNIAIVRLLLDLGADRTIVDPRYHSTAQGWADHGGHEAVAALLA